MMKEVIIVTIDGILKHVNDAVVFLDDQCCETLHWIGGLKKVLKAGALDVRDIKHSKECLESETKAVFIVSTPLLGQVSKYIQRIVKNSDFTQVIIISTISLEVNDFISQGSQSPVFEYYSRQIKLWTQNEQSVVGVYHVPLDIVEITSDIFVMPTQNDMFPVLPSDVARLQAFLHSRGDKRVFNDLGDVDFGFLPHNIQCQIKMLTSALNSMFENMGIDEHSCYSVGHYSRLIANELANMPDVKGRRKGASSHASIVFVDRTLDLVAPISHSSDSVLGIIYEVLPLLQNHNNDVAIDMTSVFSEGNKLHDTIFPGCLAHEDEEVTNMLHYFIKNSKKQCISMVHNKLIDIMKKESISCDGFNKHATLDAIRNLFIRIRNNINVIKKHFGFIQYALALTNALSDKENEHLEELFSAEKGILLELGDENNNPFLQVLNMLTDKDKNRFSVIDALMFCLLIYSGGNDISNASPTDEEKVKEAVINVLMDGSHKDDLLFLLGDLDASERQIRTRVADVFERLRDIGASRNGLKNLKNVLTKDSMGVVKYEPLVKQVIERIFAEDKPELEDIEFRSKGLKDFLKTGFGFFMNVTKPRPTDHPLIILFIVGGVTWNEIKCIQETLNKYRPSQKVLIGSTRIVTPSSILEQVLCSENLFVDVE